MLGIASVAAFVHVVETNGELWKIFLVHQAKSSF